MPDQIITVETIVRDKLKELGADGLCMPDIECGCGLGDLYPCGEMGDLCRPGYRQTCSRCGIEGYWAERHPEPWVCGECKEAGCA